MDIIKNAVYKHYKGNFYKVIEIAKHSETLENMVIYQDISQPEKVWARPASMWNDAVVIDDKIVKRFEMVS